MIADGQHPDDDGRLKQTLRRQLSDQRAALLAKLEGLSERDARLPRTPTGTNLLGLVKHCASLEADYFGRSFDRPHGLPMPWDAPGATEDDNLDFYAGPDETLDDVLAFCQACFDHADRVIAELPLHAPGHVPWWPDDMNPVTLGEVIAHVALDEARHAGHADIIREQLDGTAGLRTPGANLPGWSDDRWRRHVEELTAIAQGRPSEVRAAG